MDCGPWTVDWSMALLAIDTSSRQLGVALVENDHLLASYELLVADHPHAVELPGAVKRLLAAAGTSSRQLDAIAVDIGPGSFTGLRIGLAFAKALAFPAKTPLIGVPSLDVLASNLPYAPSVIIPVVDARQKNIYTARYHFKDGSAVRTSDYLLGKPDELIPRLNEPAIFLGDGCPIYRELILQRCPRAQFAAPELWLPRAATLARLGQERFRQGQRDDPAKLVPLYLYPLDCSVRGPDRPTSVLPTQKAPDASPASKSV